MAQHHRSKDSLIWIQGRSCCLMLIYGPEKLWLNFIPIIYNCSHHLSVKTSFLYSFVLKKWDMLGWGQWIWACVRGHKNDRDWSPRVSVVNTAQLCKWAKMRLAITQHTITYIIEAERLCSSAFFNPFNCSMVQLHNGPSWIIINHLAETLCGLYWFCDSFLHVISFILASLFSPISSSLYLSPPPLSPHRHG